MQCGSMDTEEKSHSRKLTSNLFRVRDRLKTSGLEFESQSFSDGLRPLFIFFCRGGGEKRWGGDRPNRGIYSVC